MLIGDYEKLVATILENSADQGVVSEALNTMREDYTQTLTTVEALGGEKTILLKHNESLKKVNNIMMNKLGDFSATIDSQKPIEQPIEEELPKFEDLLNSEGDLN